MTDVARIEDYRAHPSGIYVPSTASQEITTPIPPVTDAALDAPSEQGKPTTTPATTPVSVVGLPDGRTERVRELEIEVAEREEIAALQAQRAETHVESKAAQKLRQRSRDAEDKRRELANPARIALRDLRAQLVMNLVGLTASLIALGWSTANVQGTASIGLPAGSAGWWLAWGVEPLISAALLTVMGARAYLATRGVTVDNPWVTAAQWVPLGYTVTLNCWTSLPHAFVNSQVGEFLRGVIVHSVGPAVVVLLVHALPVLWAEFIGLHDRPADGVRKPSEQAHPGPASPVDEDRARQLLEIIRPAYTAGEVTSGVTAIRRFLAGQGHRAGVEMGMWIRDALKREVTRP